MPPVSQTDVWNALLSTTIRKMTANVLDQITPESVLLHQLQARGVYKKVGDIGTELVKPLRYENKAPQIVGGYDVLTTTPIDGATMARYLYGGMANDVSISRDETLQNKGPEKISSLLQLKVDQARDGITDIFNKSFFWGDGIRGNAITTPYTSTNGRLFLSPLPEMIRYNSASEVYAGIDCALNTWWRNKSKTSAATTFVTFLKEAVKFRNDLSLLAGGFPDLHITDQGTFELYRAAMAASYRNPDYEKADMPFAVLNFYGSALFWDQWMIDAHNATTTVTKGTWYMMNTKFLGVDVEESSDFSTTDFEGPINQLAKIAWLLWGPGVFWTNKRAKQGVWGNIDTTIAA